MSAFVNTNDKVEVKVALKQGAKALIVSNPDSMADVTGYEIHSFYFRKPTWAVIRDIAVESTVLTPDGRQMISSTLVADLRLRKTLADWTLTEKGMEEGKDQKVAISNQSIDRLAPELVSYLVGRIAEIFDAEVSAE